MKTTKSQSKSMPLTPANAGEYLLETLIQDTHTTLIAIRQLMQRLTQGLALSQVRPQLQALQQQLQQQLQVIETSLQLPSMRHARSAVCDAQLDDINFMQKQLLPTIRTLLAPQTTQVGAETAVAHMQLYPLIVESDQKRHASALSDITPQLSSYASSSTASVSDSDFDKQQDAMLQRMLGAQTDNFDDMFSQFSESASQSHASSSEGLSLNQQNLQPAMVSFTQGHPNNLQQRIDAYKEVVREFLANSKLERIDLPTCERKLALGQYLYGFIASQDSDFGRSLMSEASQPEIIALEQRVDALELRKGSLMRDVMPTVSSSTSQSAIMPVTPLHTEAAVSESSSSDASRDSLSETQASTPRSPSLSQVHEQVLHQHVQAPTPAVNAVPRPQLQGHLRQGAHNIRAQGASHHAAAAHPLHQAPAAIQPAHEPQRGFMARLMQRLARPFQALRERIFPNDDRRFLAQAHQAQPYHHVQRTTSISQTVVDVDTPRENPSLAANANVDDKDESVSRIRLHH